MVRRYVSFLFSLVLAWSAFGASQTEPQKKPEQPAKSQPTEGASAPPSVPAGQPASEAAKKQPTDGSKVEQADSSKPQAVSVASLPPVRRVATRADYEKRRIAQLKRLWADVKKKLNLSPEQVVEVDRMFEEYIQHYKEGKYSGRDSRPSPRDPTHPPELRELYANLEAAKKNGDAAAVRNAETALEEYLKTAPPAPSIRDQRFLGELMGSVKPEQQSLCFEIVQRWQALHPRVPGDDPYRRIRRALLDPDLRLSEDQEKKIRAILDAAKKEIGEPGKGRDLTKLEPVSKRAKEEAFTHLTDEQKKLVEATMAQFAEDDEIYATMDVNKGRSKDASKTDFDPDKKEE